MGRAVKPLRGKPQSRISIRRARVEQLRERLELEQDPRRRKALEAQLAFFEFKASAPQR